MQIENAGIIFFQKNHPCQTPRGNTHDYIDLNSIPDAQVFLRESLLVVVWYEPENGDGTTMVCSKSTPGARMKFRYYNWGSVREIAPADPNKIPSWLMPKDTTPPPQVKK